MGEDSKGAMANAARTTVERRARAGAGRADVPGAIHTVICVRFYCVSPHELLLQIIHFLTWNHSRIGTLWLAPPGGF